MTTIFRSLCIALLGMLLITAAFGAERETTMKFPSPGRQGVLRIASGEGDITVTGYNGDEVVIVADSDEMIDDPDDNDERARGLRRIAGNTFRIYTDEDENAVIINRSMQHETDLYIRVPRQTSVYIGGSSRRGAKEIRKEVEKVSEKTQLKANEDARNADERRNTGSTVTIGNGEYINIPTPLHIDINIPPFNFIGGGVLEGDIIISDVSGDIEVNAIDGDITVNGITGSIIASAVDGDIEAELVRLTGENPLSFTSVDGDIDVSLPANLSADIQMRSTDGEIYTNYDITINPASPERRSGDVFFFGNMTGNTIYGTINGGGRELTLKTVDGNIYLRKIE